LLAGCGQILGLGDYEVGEETSGSGGSAGSAGTGGDSGSGGGGTGGDAGTGGGGTGGSAGADGGSAGVGTTTTASGGDAGSSGTGGTTTTSPTTTGMGGSAGSGECVCDLRDPCLTGECDEAGECIPKELGAECLSGNFAGVCNGTQQCVPCVNDAPDTDVDSGCPETAPECDDSGATPECTGCQEDMDCDDGVDCTADTCDDGRCMRAVLPAGAECSDGVCNGEGAADSCVPCVDNQPAGLDAGCEAALPFCDTSVLPAACVECLVADDCDDDNECTTETCDSRECVGDTVPAGDECTGGFCSGIPGMESCGACFDTAAGNEIDQGCPAEAPVCDMSQLPPVCTGCTVNTDCDDAIDCTTDTCSGAGVCVHTPDDGVCAASGYVCLPNQCVVGVGCSPVDITEEVQLVANGNLDSGGSWSEASSNGYPLIVVEDATVAAHTPTRYAWLGGAWYEFSELFQLVSVPTGTQALNLNFFYQLSTNDPYYWLPYNYNVMGAEILSSDGGTVLQTILALGNQDTTGSWTEVSVDLDPSWAGTDVLVYFWASIGAEYYSSGYYFGNTNFRIDTVSLTASVCQ